MATKGQARKITRAKRRRRSGIAAGVGIIVVGTVAMLFARAPNGGGAPPPPAPPPPAPPPPGAPYQHTPGQTFTLGGYHFRISYITESSVTGLWEYVCQDLDNYYGRGAGANVPIACASLDNNPNVTWT